VGVNDPIRITRWSIAELSPVAVAPVDITVETMKVAPVAVGDT
jgi:hypothetical protein